VAEGFVLAKGRILVSTRGLIGIDGVCKAKGVFAKGRTCPIVGVVGGMIAAEEGPALELFITLSLVGDGGVFKSMTEFILVNIGLTAVGVGGLWSLA